jgi:hypothetical protein
MLRTRGKSDAKELIYKKYLQQKILGQGEPLLLTGKVRVNK